MVGKPQGRKPWGRTEASAGAVGYGDLNEDAGPGELDSGTDAGGHGAAGCKAGAAGAV